MTSIYEELQPVATELMKEFKQGTINHIKITAGTTGTEDNPGEPIETSTEVDATVKGVSFKFLQNGFSVVGDKIITVGVNSKISPSIGDFFEIDNERWKAVADISVPAAGTRVAWKFIIRKGG
jgi:hypothetical protein